MSRLPDWEQRLSDYLAEVRDHPHEYGRHDCMAFCAGAVKAVTGKDPARGHRGKYQSAASAARYLKRLGFDSPAEMVSSLLEERPILFAQRGDLVADEAGIPGVCVGGEAAFVGQEGEAHGLVYVPRSGWAKAWKVG